MTSPNIPATAKACFTCRWWKPTPKHDLSYPWGTCRVSHPADWRNTAPDDWCGVHDFPEPPRAD